MLIDDTNLPEHFHNEIVSENGQDTIVIRSNVRDLDDCKSWIEAFSLKTSTKWNAEISNPRGKAMTCRKRYVCHRSSFQKVERDENKRGRSKNSYCKARINFKIKKITRDTKKKDVFVKNGLICVITIDKVHNHSLNSAEALRFLPATDEIREKFYQYFSDGMSLQEAKKHHEDSMNLGDSSPEDFANSRLNPTCRMIRYMHDNWRLKNLGPRSGESVVAVCTKNQSNRASEDGPIEIQSCFIQSCGISNENVADANNDSVRLDITEKEIISVAAVCTKNQSNRASEDGPVEIQSCFIQSCGISDENFAAANNDSVRLNITEKEIMNSNNECIQEILDMLSTKLFSIPCNLDDLMAFKNQLMKTRTEGQLASFLRTAGSYSTPLRRKSGSSIRLQPSTISRRIQLTRGNKHFPVGRPPVVEIQKKNSIRKKMKHCLAANVNLKLPNATSQ